MVRVRDSPDLEPKKSYLILEDGTLFEGYSFGANLDTKGEIGKINKRLFSFYFLKNIKKIFKKFFQPE